MSLSICLKGFPDNEVGKVVNTLTSKGMRVVRSLDAAQLIVAGADAPRNMFQIAQHRGLPLLSWDEFRKRHLAHSTDDVGEADPIAAALQSEEIRPLVERKPGRLRILDVWFDLPDGRECEGKFRGLVPTQDRFKHICMDQGFAETLRAVCIGASHDLPVAIEGETSSSKTTAVLWLAHLLGQPVIRMNLNSQTDAGELIGRYVPDGGIADLDLSVLLEHAPHFSPASQGMVQAASSAGRSLTRLETLTLVGREGLPMTNWKFQEGWLLKAIQNGFWMLLDEMNLAEPQVLERLNSVLETPRTLVLSEGNGAVFGPNGDIPFHDRFRLFSTSNPAEYAGRSVLSPAFRDRWTVWHQATPAGESDYLAMLRFLAFGEHPVIRCRGGSYQADRCAPVLGHLVQLPDVESLIRSLAMFQAAVVKASGTDGSPPSLGRGRRERYSFTRRTLVTALQHIDRQIAAGAKPQRQLVREALELFYINRLRDAGDRNSLLSLLRAADI